MYPSSPSSHFQYLLTHTHPAALAWIQGSASNPRLAGSVKFYQTTYGGVLIEAEIFGLPNIDAPGSTNFYGMHIHEHGNCTRPFDQTGSHYNPGNVPHPQHSGDLPPLLGNQGYAYTVFYDKRFFVKDIIGRSLVIHSMADDFTSQPSGNSGSKIGCGIIQSVVN